MASALTLATGIAASAASAAGPATTSANHHAPLVVKARPLVPTNPFPIVTNLDGMCLSIDGGNTEAGAGVDMEGGVLGGTAYQEWTYNPVNGNLISAVNGQHNLCLDDRYNNPAGGAALDLWGCSPGRTPGSTTSGCAVSMPTTTPQPRTGLTVVPVVMKTNSAPWKNSAIRAWRNRRRVSAEVGRRCSSQ